MEGAKEGPAKAVVRALADRNVFWIESPAPAFLEPVVHGPIPAAKLGTTNGIRWLLQDFPGDLDWPGMQYAVALSERGTCKVAAVVTSLESPQPLAEALKRVRATLEATPETLVEKHEAIWREFWSASGVELDDSLLRDSWYRNLYFLRCVSKPGVTAVGLFAGLVDNAAAWHGSYTMNYNAEQTFFSSFNANHLELAEPYTRLILEYMPRARYVAREVYDCDGACFPHNLYGHDNLDPAQCRSNKRRQHFYHTWSYSLGVTGFSVQNVWWQLQVPAPIALSWNPQPIPLSGMRRGSTRISWIPARRTPTIPPESSWLQRFRLNIGDGLIIWSATETARSTSGSSVLCSRRPSKAPGLWGAIPSCASDSSGA